MKISPNEPCPCGSGKKYKKCCMQKDDELIALEFEKEKELHFMSEDFEFYDEFEDDFYDDFEDEFLEELDENEELFGHYDMERALLGINRLFLGKKPHIKKYMVIRNLHEEIMSGMMDYISDGKFTQTMGRAPELAEAAEMYSVHAEFDMNTREGSHGFTEISIYKMSPNIICLTEVFLEKHRYRKPEKIELLQAMLESQPGLFEILSTDSNNGYVTLKNVLSDEEIIITDTGLSMGTQPENLLLYTRIISFKGINFGTGLNLIFDRKDSFIKKFIKKEKKNFSRQQDYRRFFELYNYYIQNPPKVRVVTNKF